MSGVAYIYVSATIVKHYHFLIMTRTFILLFTSLFSLSLFGQKIKLTQTKSADDIKIMNGKYVIYMRKVDVDSAILEIDKVVKTNNSALVTLIKAGKIKSIDLNSTLPTDKAFIDLIKSNLGAFLLSKGKATIFSGTKSISEIAPDESPEIVESDGTSRVSIFFSEPGLDSPIFLGDLNTKLKSNRSPR